jgi:hypothetical protein
VYRYNILVAQATKDILAESIARYISERTDVNLVFDRVFFIHEVSDFLNKKLVSPNIVILVGHNNELEKYSKDFLISYPDIVIARVVIGNEVVQMDLRELDVNELILSVCSLSKYHNVHLEQGLTEYNFISRHSITNKKGIRLGLVEIKPPQTILRKALSWLDSLLRVHLKRTSPSKDDIPGLSVSRTTIENLLQEVFDENSLNVSDQQSIADSSLRELMTDINDPKFLADPLVAVCKGFGFTSLEIQAFLLCLAPDIDAKYERIFGFSLDDLGRHNATLGLVSSLLGDALKIRVQLANSSLFNHWQIFAMDGKFWPHSDDPLRIDTRLISWILGNKSALLKDDLLIGVVLENPWKGGAWINEPRDVQIADELKQILSSEHSGPHWIVLAGNDLSVSRAIVENSTENFIRPLLRVSISTLDSLDSNAVDESLKRLSWAVRLTESIPVIDAGDSFSIQTMKRLMKACDDINRACILIVRDIIRIIDILPYDNYRIFLTQSLSNSPPIKVFAKAGTEIGMNLSEEDIERVASAYPLPLEDIYRAFCLAAARRTNAGQWVDQQVKLIADACRDVSCPDLPRFATALEPSFRLNDVVLPDDRRQQIDDIVSNVSHARKVLSQWGFDAQLPYGKGITALFTGPSGTGKTMAARAIGQALQRRVFLVDLSRVVSKYIGETEKNLDMVFLEAERGGAILLFDEADALFGKRSEVKDAHDRYANIETAYLLQRMEAFTGLAILTSNLGQNLDQAFLRRLRHVVEFPLPSAAAREKIWRQCFPPEAPIAENVNFSYLAQCIEITGGNIQQIAVRAAFLAASEGDDVRINLKHILNATRAEVLKLGLRSLARELLDYAA